ncbi:hypothetical protein [Vulgatibacter sp.]|uniref:hypothetical protein n=1 Tax=Vulgatibacter sp. TaxID=1971226 RepID=UPI003568229F
MTSFALPFFDSVAPLRMSDPLAELLGVVQPGAVFEYRYEDCVRLAGHSCLAVAGAWAIAARALPALFEGGLPVRGAVEVVALGAPEELAFGPMAMVIGAIAGAEGEAGFGGLWGAHRRRGLLRFAPDRFVANGFELRRLDGRGAILATYHPEKLQGAGPSPLLLPRLLAGEASPEEHRAFVERWQGLVREALLDPPADLVQIRAIT